MSEPIPEDIVRVLFRALTWCGTQINDDEREQAWSYVEAQRDYNVEEVGS